MDLLPSQKQRVFNVLKSEGVNPATVRFTKKTSRAAAEPSWIILVPGTKYYFSFEYDSEVGRAVSYSPGIDVVEAAQSSESWDVQLNQLRRWCRCLQRELEASDPWEDLERQKVPFSLGQDNESAAQPFTVREFEQVQKTLNVIQTLLIAYARDNEQQHAAIRGEITRLLEWAKTQDRKSWYYFVTGFIINTAVTMALAPDQTRRLFEALKEGLSSAIKLIPA